VLDDIGAGFSSLEEARIEASRALAEMAKDVLPGSIVRILSVEVRTDIGPLLRVSLRFEVAANGAAVGRNEAGPTIYRALASHCGEAPPKAELSAPHSAASFSRSRMRRRFGCGLLFNFEIPSGLFRGAPPHQRSQGYTLVEVASVRAEIDRARKLADR
jgi:hypothetical protein